MEDVVEVVAGCAIKTVVERAAPKSRSSRSLVSRRRRRHHKIDYESARRQA